MLWYNCIGCFLPRILWQMLLPCLTVEILKHILWQMLCLYMVADIIPYVVADVIAQLKQGGRC